jgi:hypothetical protein
MNAFVTPLAVANSREKSADFSRTTRWFACVRLVWTLVVVVVVTLASTTCHGVGLRPRLSLLFLSSSSRLSDLAFACPL